MGFEEKITELLRLREQGLLTPDEFDALVKRAREDQSKTAALPVPPIEHVTRFDHEMPGSAASATQTNENLDRTSSAERKKKIGVVAALVVVGVIIAVLVVGGGESDPKKSKKYQELVVQQKDLERELSSVEADVVKLNEKVEAAQTSHDAEMKKLDDERLDWLRRADNNRKALKDLEALK